MHKMTFNLLSGTFALLLVLITPPPLQATGYDEQGCDDTGVVFEKGHGCWVYHDTGANSDKPVRVWYYYPPNFSKGSRKVVFAMHGSERDAMNAIERWQKYAVDYGALIIAPEFSRLHYPKGRNYNRGNVRDASGAIRPFADWTFTTIEEIFDHVIKSIPDAPQRYSLQGHSGGGQFVQRMALLASNYRIETAVPANPGWYMLPDENYRYPCGISNLPQQSIDLAAAYAGNLTITLGTEDNDPNAQSLNSGSCASLQGTNRYDRGRFFFDVARKDAKNRGLPFNWKLVEIEGVGHNANAMVHKGADIIMGSTPIQQKALVLNPTQDATVKASYQSSNYGLRSILQVDGDSLKTTYMQFDLRSLARVDTAVLRLEVTDPSNGVQYIHEAKNNDWSESDITFSKQPGIANLITTINGSATGDLSIDLSEFIRSRLGKVITLVFSSSDANGLYFKSGESASPPALELYH
jgi:pimeloyl-ACP methyl ester carboxylesterase